MSQYLLNGPTTMTFVGSAAAVSGQLVYMYSTTSKSVVLTSAETDMPIGVIADGQSVSATSGGADEPISIIPLNTGGSHKMRASAVIAANALVMPAADGEIATHTGATSYIVGVALEAATAADDLIEVFMFSPSRTSAS